MTDSVPESIREAVRRAVSRHDDDIEQQKQCAVELVQKATDYKAYRESLVIQAIHELVYRERVQINGVIRRDTVGPAKVNLGKAEAIQSTYGYFIGGRRLGQIFGRELAGIAESEGNLANGHLFNQRLASRLIGLVKDDERVQDAVKESKLRLIFKECAA